MAFTPKTMTRIELFFEAVATEDPAATPWENCAEVIAKIENFVSGEVEGSDATHRFNPSPGIQRADFNVEIKIPDEESSVRLRTKLESNLTLFDNGGITLKRARFFFSVMYG